MKRRRCKECREPVSKPHAYACTNVGRNVAKPGWTPDKNRARSLAEDSR